MLEQMEVVFFCGKGIETRDHLFFSCPYSSHISSGHSWSQVLDELGMACPIFPLLTELEHDFNDLEELCNHKPQATSEKSLVTMFDQEIFYL